MVESKGGMEKGNIITKPIDDETLWGVPDPTTEVRTCRVCGCTDNRACPGGCHWVAEDFCSQCCGVEGSTDWY